VKAVSARDISARSIDVYIELKSPQAHEKTERDIRAWKGFAQVEHLSDEVAVLRLYPGAATQLKDTQARRGEGHELTSTLP
jgi:hypothetical protein